MAYCLNAGVSASPSATAFAAITCSSGPPWIPGKTCLSTSFPNASWQRINPPRGPRSELILCQEAFGDRKSTRLNSSHLVISYAVFCLKKKKGRAGELHIDGERGVIVERHPIF